MRRLGKKGLAWIKERDQWIKDHPQDYYSCHYCYKSLTIDEDSLSMGVEILTLDHENNRNHKGRLLPCCWFDNGRKGSMSHDRYVAKYYPDHVCDYSG